MPIPVAYAKSICGVYTLEPIECNANGWQQQQQQRKTKETTENMIISRISLFT